MQDVYQAAKCENFSQVFIGPGGIFPSFHEMVPSSNDPRVQFETCSDTGLFDTDIDVMRNDDFLYFGFEPAVLPSGDNINSYTDPSVCTGLPPISTGINVVITENFGEPTEVITEYSEHFCANPGCYYDHTTATCTK
jgi:hypothetical protein